MKKNPKAEALKISNFVIQSQNLKFSILRFLMYPGLDHKILRHMVKELAQSDGPF